MQRCRAAARIPTLAGMPQRARLAVALVAVVAVKGCTAPECTNAHHARGFCRTHYNLARAADPDAPGCGWLEGCERRAVALGLCGTHYDALRWNADPKALASWTERRTLIERATTMTARYTHLLWALAVVACHADLIRAALGTWSAEQVDAHLRTLLAEMDAAVLDEATRIVTEAPGPQDVECSKCGAWWTRDPARSDDAGRRTCPECRRAASRVRAAQSRARREPS